MGRLQPITTEETKNQSSVVDFLWIIVLELIHDIWTDIILQYWITAQRLSVGLGGAGSVTHITPCSSYEPRRDAQHGYFWREEWTNNGTKERSRRKESPFTKRGLKQEVSPWSEVLLQSASDWQMEWDLWHATRDIVTLCDNMWGSLVTCWPLDWHILSLAGYTDFLLVKTSL